MEMFRLQDFQERKKERKKERLKEKEKTSFVGRTIEIRLAMSVFGYNGRQLQC